MTGIVAALLAAALAAPPGPMPDNTSIDSLTFTFSSGPLQAGGFFIIHADGKVSYSHQTAPYTGSGGIVTQKTWTLTKDERTELFRNLVAAGLLDIPDAKKPQMNNTFTVTSGRWQFTIHADPIPEKVMAHLRPLLAKAHPVLWTEKPPPKAEPEKPKLTQFQYAFTPKAEGEAAVFAVRRDGTVTYKRNTHPNSPDGPKELVKEEWKIPAKDAEALLDALVADGLFDLEDTLGGKFPNHRIIAHSGRWYTTFYPKAMPEKLMKHLLPLMKKADAEYWK